MAPPDDRPPPGTWERDERTVAWIYGSILVAAAVVVASEVIATEAAQILLYTAATMLVVWLAHSYAAFVGHGGRVDIGPWDPASGMRLVRSSRSSRRPARP